ncbi:MAG: hypothetical protein QMD03_09290 [Syntrophales bacterium]|nr:hypothetical protein [Syntrophales bacterium]
MSPRSKREHTEAIHLRYKNATRHEKTIILDEYLPSADVTVNMPSARGRISNPSPTRFERFTKPKAKKRGKPTFSIKQAMR